MSTSTQTTAPLTLLASKDVGTEDRTLRLRTMYGLNVTSRSDLVADYVWFPHGKKYGIELKMGSDLLGSLADKRIVGQAKRMVAELDFPILLFVGKLGHERATGKAVLNGGETNWDYRSIMSMLSDLGMIGMFIEQWDGDAAERVAAWVINTHKGDHAWLKGRTRPQVWALVPSYNNAIWGLCSKEGIGPKTAESLLKKYLSEAGVYTAAVKAAGKPKAVKEFSAGVEGLGLKRAQQFIEEVTEEHV